MTQVTEFQFYNPDAPKSWWPKEIFSRAWEYTATLNKHTAMVFEAPDEESAIIFARRYGAATLHGTQGPISLK